MKGGDFAITMAIRLTCPTKETTAALEIMSGEIKLTTDNQVTDLTDLASSKILTCRTIMGRVMFDTSIRKILSTSSVTAKTARSSSSQGASSRT